MKTFSIGRSQECDVVVADPSVSRRHAEIAVHSAADFVLVDCDSKFGTFLRRDGEWRPVSSSGVDIDDEIRLGHHETTVRTLVTAVLDRLRGPAVDPAPDPEPPGAGGARRTIVERDPETGEIIFREARTRG